MFKNIQADIAEIKRLLPSLIESAKNSPYKFAKENTGTYIYFGTQQTLTGRAHMSLVYAALIEELEKLESSPATPQTNVQIANLEHVINKLF